MEIKNYRDFRKELNNYLDKHPILNTLKNKVIKLYFKNKCKFIIKANTFKNIYYYWRINSMVYSKYAMFKYNIFYFEGNKPSLMVLLN